MLLGKRIAVVIPCYRVANHIGGVVRSLPDLVDHILLVDDGSPDDFAGAVARLGDRRLAVLRHDANHGLARAMVTGFRHALALGADVIVKMDGDGQMDPAQLPRMLAPIVEGRADLTKGNRLAHRRHQRGMPLVRLVGNLGLSFLTKMASGYWHVADPANGYVAMRRELLEEIDLDRLGPGYFFESSLLIESYLAGAVVRDVALPSRYGGEPSSLSVGESLLRFPPLLLRAYVRRLLLRYFLRDFTPVALFLVVGLPLMAFGTVFGAWRWFENYGSGVPTPTGTVIVAVLPLLVGFQLLLEALVMDITSAPRESPWAGLDRQTELRQQPVSHLHERG